MSETTAEEAVTLDVEDGVATVRLNQPDVRNALVPAIQQGIVDRLGDVREHDDARCVVLTGSDAAFCAGGNISGMRERQEREDDPAPAEGAQRITDTVHETIKSVAEFPLPTVAAVSGPAFGAGASLALSCDVQVASDEAQIGWGFRQVGLAVDSGTTYFLPRIVGENTAKELVFTGELLDAERADDLGIFNHVFPDDEFDERLAEFVEPIATGPTLALSTSKRLIDEGLESSLDQALHNEATAQATLYDSEDHQEGVAAFFDRREPEFQGE